MVQLLKISLEVFWENFMVEKIARAGIIGFRGSCWCIGFSHLGDMEVGLVGGMHMLCRGVMRTRGQLNSYFIYFK